MKKYEFTGEVKKSGSITLRRIRYLIDIHEAGIKAGDLGGWLESEDNLSHYGNAQVYDDAMVYGNAQVYGNAVVSDDAQVFGNAVVSGNAQVSGDARVFGIARVYGYARVYGIARVSDAAHVCGNAHVFGNAQVYGDAHVFGDAQVDSHHAIFTASHVGRENGTLTVTKGKNGLIVTRGCFIGSVEEFLEASARVHDETTRREYELLIEVAKSRINNHNGA